MNIWNISRNTDMVSELMLSWVNNENESLNALKSYGRKSMNTRFKDETQTEAANYNEYELFSLLTRYQSMLDMYMHGAKVSSSKSYTNSSIVFIVELDEEEVTPNNTMRRMLEHAENYMDNYCIILDTSYPILYKGVCFSVEWISSIMHCIHLKASTEGVFTPEEDLKVVDGRVYANLSKSAAYKASYREIKTKVLDIIHRMYTIGTLSLDPDVDAKFIHNWELEESIIEGIYHPTWSNYWITSSPTDFLVDKLLGHNGITFKIFNNDNDKHHISSTLSGKCSYIFMGNYVHVKVNSYKEACNIHRLIVESMNKPTGYVYTKDVPNTIPELGPQTFNFTSYLDIEKGIVKSYMEKINDFII